MMVYEPVNANEMVFPQDVQEGVGEEKKHVRYGGLSKREMAAMINVAALLQNGIPRDTAAANVVFATATSMADGLLMFLAANPQQEPSLIEKPSGGLVS